MIRAVVATDTAGCGRHPTALSEPRFAHAGACTAKSTIFTASIAAGLLREQFTRWLRQLVVDTEAQPDLLSTP